MNSKKGSKITLIVIAVLIIISIQYIEFSYAAELNGSTGGSLNALNSGYAITRWPWDGGTIYPGEDATVRACTSQPPHPEATEVVFRWIRPDGTYWDVGPVSLTNSLDTWNGKPVWDAYSTETIDMLGDWGVQALFQDSEGNIKGPNDPYEIVAIRAISWHSVPELPLGTIAATIAMFGAFILYNHTRLR